MNLLTIDNIAVSFIQNPCAADAGEDRSISSVLLLIYAPCRRIDGMTSDVIHRLNAFAAGSLLDMIRLYKPDSLT